MGCWLNLIGTSVTYSGSVFDYRLILPVRFCMLFCNMISKYDWPPHLVEPFHDDKNLFSNEQYRTCVKQMEI